VARREDRRRFWTAVAAGQSGEDAALCAGVSPAVGARWFREAGGMPPATLAPAAEPPSGRYLSFADREEIALWRAQGHGVRELARRLAALHPRQPLLAFTVDARVRSQLALSWGVETFLVPSVQHTDDMVAQVDFSLLSIGRLKVGDRVVSINGDGGFMFGVLWPPDPRLGITKACSTERGELPKLKERLPAKPIVDRVFPLEEAAAAHSYLEEGRQFGKVVLAIP
jgi:hypothetical protein